MGLSLGSIVSAVTDPGGLVKDAINTVLPKNLAIVGDIAGAYVDFQTGHGLGAAQHAFEALKDLPQAANALSSMSSRCGSPAFEPTPPPTRPPLGQIHSGHWQPGQTAPGWHGTATTPPQTTIANANAVKQDPLSSLNQFAQALEKALKMLQSALKQFSGAAPGTTTPKPETTHATKKSSSADAADDDTSTKSTSSKKSSESSSSKKSDSTDSASSTKKSDSSKKSDTDAELKKLNKMSDKDFMAALRNGDVPKEVLDDPRAMMMIQQRMNQISEMNKLMTSMMQALHDMQMAVIQNVRV